MADPFFNNVSLLLHLNGSDNSITFEDSSNNNVSVWKSGSAKIATSPAGGPSPSSLSLDGVNSYIAAAGDLRTDFGSGNFTVELWVYLSTTPNGEAIICDRYTGGGDRVSFALFFSGTSSFPSNGSNIAFGIFNGSSWSGLALSGQTVALNTWTHLAVVRENGLLTIYRNGIILSISSFTNVIDTADAIYVGRRWDTAGARNFLHGYIDEVRITNQIARYSLNFTSPNAQFTEGTDPYWSNTSLLLHMDGSNGSTAFTDSSSSNLSVTVSGDAQISTTESRFGGASAFFDGAGDYLVTASNAAVALGSGDFTIEMWVRRTSEGSYRTFAGTRPDNGGYTDGWSMGVGPSNELYFYSNGFICLSANGLMLLNTWHHVAISRLGTNVVLHLDGVVVATGTNTQNFSRQIMGIGALPSGQEPLTGYIDEIRVTKGVSRYLLNFTPSTGEFEDEGYVSINYSADTLPAFTSAPTFRAWGAQESLFTSYLNQYSSAAEIKYNSQLNLTIYPIWTNITFTGAEADKANLYPSYRKPNRLISSV